MEQIKEQLTDIKSMNMDELTEFIISLGEKKFRAKQIYEWIHVKHVESFDEMTNISKKFMPCTSAESSAASSAVSFTPPTRLYSKVTLRPVCAK